MKKGKKLCGFSFSINMANFGVFCCTKKLISNLFFLKSAQYTYVPQFWQNNHIFFKISGILKVKSQVLGMIVISFFSKQQNNTNYKLQWSGREEKKISSKMGLTKKH